MGGDFADSGFGGKVFRWDRGPTLDRNPMVWLQEYSWTARLTKWGWFLLVIVAEYAMFVAFPDQSMIAVLSSGRIAQRGRKFRRERQNSLLELLVSPLSVPAVVAGRFVGHLLPFHSRVRHFGRLLEWWLLKIREFAPILRPGCCNLRCCSYRCGRGPSFSGA